eukprot:TRINITY_DN15127_c0_g2_i3.p1 TRINITY_DN15127_c0_g2~~TRINITY_DN15127_c0_g2_i3.p1  ORF type:complete len:245 (+),score=78.53 TRINITY_DN15127_c0_g2_i3:54-737(+)
MAAAPAADETAATNSAAEDVILSAMAAGAAKSGYAAEATASVLGTPEAYAAIGGNSSTTPPKEAERPKEDLELRKSLEDLTEARGKDRIKGELENLLKIMRRLAQDVLNPKLHEMRRDVLERIAGEHLFFVFEAAAFEERPAKETSAAAFVWKSGPDATERLKTTIHEVQRAADLCLDPDTVTFAQVSELVQENRTLPGIQDVNDKVESPVAPKDSAMTRPKKPWEK